jgi:predicted nuclease of predicted toxin-antitoxin system
MKFKIDENLPIEVADLLRQAGHDALTVGEQNMSGVTDVTIASVCQSEQRAILTLDLDFADIRTYPPSEYSGIMVLRLSHQDKAFVLQIVHQVIRKLDIEPLNARLWIVEDNQIRIRE